MKQIFVLLLLAALCFVSCSHKKTTDYLAGDYVIVGSTGGFAGPIAMTPYYLIANGQLREDATLGVNRVPQDIHDFHFDVLMPAAKYDSVKDLILRIPSELLGHPTASYGTSFPDAGYTEVRASIRGVNYYWQFQIDQTGTSAAIQDYISLTNKLR
jgi:hypothetical protein